MPKLRKITILIIVLLIGFSFALIFRNFLIAFILLCPTVFFVVWWHNLLAEELIIYHLMKNGKEVDRETLSKFVGKKANKAIDRLLAKEIIEFDKNFIKLKIDDYKFSMTKWSP